MMELGLILMIDLGFPLSTSVAGEYLQFCICYMGCPFFLVLGQSIIAMKILCPFLHFFELFNRLIMVIYPSGVMRILQSTWHWPIIHVVILVDS